MDLSPSMGLRRLAPASAASWTAAVPPGRQSQRLAAEAGASRSAPPCAPAVLASGLSVPVEALREILRRVLRQLSADGGKTRLQVLEGGLPATLAVVSPRLPVASCDRGRRGGRPGAEGPLIDEEQDHRADHRPDKPAEDELVLIADAQELGEDQVTHECAGDSEHRGHEETHALLAGKQRPGQEARDDAKDDCTDDFRDIHGPLVPARGSGNPG